MKLYTTINRRVFRFAVVLLFASGSSVALGGVAMTFSTTVPTTSARDQFDFTDDAAVPGGTTPGGGTYNSQAFADNGGPPGQTFTTPSGVSTYTLNSISLKGAATGGGNSGGGVFNTGTTWGVRISSVSGTTLSPIKTVTGIPTVTGATGIEWYTWTFSGADMLSLTPSTQYAFEVYSSSGWLGFDADTSDGYAGGTAFNSSGGARSFADNTTGNLANHLYDRTFHVKIGDHILRPGDVDDDGDVDLVDFAAIRDHFQTSVASRALGDLDGDGFVDFPDYRQWKASFPFPSAGLGSDLSASVPEPSSWLLAVAGMSLLGLARRRSNRCRDSAP